MLNKIHTNFFQESVASFVKAYMIHVGCVSQILSFIHELYSTVLLHITDQFKVVE